MKFKTKLLTAILLSFTMLCPSIMQAQKVIFPQEKQPGIAIAAVSVDGNEYSISNDLFTAKFIKNDGKLFFNGCSELGLLPGSELFTVQLADGTEIPASEFTIEGEVTTETLTADENAVKGSKRFAGVQIKAQFTHSNGLGIEWHAVLRDGSHYLRTELVITAQADIAMGGITPMMYTVENGEGEKAPSVVGNTRGAVILSDKIFAGLETPTAYNTAGEATDLDNFVFKAWAGAASWAWEVEGKDIPQGIKNLNEYVEGTVRASRGYLVFREKGNCKITFAYKGGYDGSNNRLQILGVDILDLEGKVVASDYHFGFTGGSYSNRDYTVNIPSANAYMVRFFVTSKGNGEGFGSEGDITYSTKVTLPSLVYDLASTETPKLTPEIFVEEGETPTGLQNGMTYYIAANTKQSNGSFVPRYMYVEDNALKNSTTRDTDADAKYQWTLVADNDGWYVKNGTGKYLSYANKSLTVADAAYHFKFTDDVVNKVTGAYALYNPTSSGGKYMVMAAGGGSYNQNTVAVNNGSWCSDYILTPAYVIAKGGTMTENWVSNSWTAALNIPQEILNMGYTNAQVVSMEKKVTFEATGKLDVTFTWEGGNHRLDLVGVDLVDAAGKVISGAYKRQDINSSAPANYKVVVGAGTYTLRYFVETKTETVDSNGIIEVVHSSFPELNAETQNIFEWNTNSGNDGDWSAFKEWTGELPEGINDLGDAKYIDKYYNMPAGKVTVMFDYKEGSGAPHKLNTLGVQLIDMAGNVVNEEFRNASSGTNTTATYTVLAPEAGSYTLRCIVWRTNGDYKTTGDIKISFAEIKVLGTINDDETLADSWTPEMWTDPDDATVPARVIEVGCHAQNARLIERTIKVNAAGTMSVEFVYSEGTERLDIVAVELIDGNGNTAASDYHAGYAGDPSANNKYSFDVTVPGTYTLRYYANNAVEINSSGSINIGLKVDYKVHLIATETTPIKGFWSRKTTLASTENWKVSSVVGIVAPGQARRSFLAYSERERAVPWRAFPCYISWYELNINRNNAADPTNNMTEAQVLDVLAQWKEKYYDKYGKEYGSPAAFIIDDGWDNYGTWTFHNEFPNQMREISAKAKEMNAGVGAWLGPVGGYGTSGDYRRRYWDQEGRGGMLLSNPAYYTVFKDAAYNLVCNQDGQKGFDRNTDNYVFFKFDGISNDFSALGPDRDLDVHVANEAAEGIIRLERYVREELREDIFFNTTVGTWASPFWYNVTDATWRQENDHDRVGNNSINRENWITYRDRLVYQNYVQNSPICPINTLMTHGFILTNYGPPAGDSQDYNAVLRELRCAFLCGSGMVELYNDYALMNSINDGKLWEDLAECIAWQKKNADVLPDAHWVGGNPWTGAKAEIYGWASWNGEKATLALRNGANDAQTYTFTLREALEIPEYINTTITLTKSFADQVELTGITEGTAIGIDDELTVTLPGSTVYAFDGVDNSVVTNITPEEKMEGKYYRFKDANGKYLSADATKLTVNANADAASIFYLTEDSKLLSYSAGLFLNKVGGFEQVNHTGNVAHFKNGSAENTVMIGIAPGVYLSSDGTTVATQGGDWTMEEVTSLPVTVTAAKFATFYAPVAVAMPESQEITAHTVVTENDRPTAMLSDPLSAIPANTGVVLYANVEESTTFNLDITQVAPKAISLEMKGTLTRTLVTKPEGKECYVLARGENGVGLYIATNGNDNNTFYNAGHKAYLEVTEKTNGANFASYSFRFNVATAIEEVEDKNVEVKTIYDLTGRKVEVPAKGMYIINGKKVFIK